MANSDSSVGGGRDLRVDPAKLFSASGGFDAISAELGGKQVSILEEKLDTGSPDLDGALGRFSESWTEGMGVILGDQAQIADGLRTAVKNYTGVDVDAAYLFQVLTSGLDGT